MIREVPCLGAPWLAVAQSDSVLAAEALRLGERRASAGSACRCAFTASSIYDFTLTVIDIKNNEVVMVVRQSGALMDRVLP